MTRKTNTLKEKRVDAFYILEVLYNMKAFLVYKMDRLDESSAISDDGKIWKVSAGGSTHVTFGINARHYDQTALKVY
jgi:hypothetical protein